MRYFVESGYESLCKKNEELCGDKVEIARLDDRIIAVLADGLGSGVKANILATLTSKILVTMLKAEADLTDVVETISHTLPVCKVRGLAYSTFTIIQIMNTGETHVVEFDNPSIFYIHDGEVGHVKSEHRVVGGMNIKESSFWMSDGDILVTVSDGVIHAGIGGLLNLGWQAEHVEKYLYKITRQATDASSIAVSLRQACESLYAGMPGDDTTVVALRLRHKRDTVVAVGPPKDILEDRQMANMLLDATGYKIVCGGTTSMIIARHMRKEVEVDLDTLDADIPPTGCIEGIDLVTEGIITISHAFEYLDRYYRSGALPETDNGAVKLFNRLRNSDSVRFIVGRAINPAHQHPKIAADFGLKIKVIQEIADILEKNGVHTELTYF